MYISWTGMNSYFKEKNKNDIAYWFIWGEYALYAYSIVCLALPKPCGNPVVIPQYNPCQP